MTSIVVKDEKVESEKRGRGAIPCLYWLRKWIEIITRATSIIHQNSRLHSLTDHVPLSVQLMTFKSLGSIVNPESQLITASPPKVVIALKTVTVESLTWGWPQSTAEQKHVRNCTGIVIICLCNTTRILIPAMFKVHPRIAWRKLVSMPEVWVLQTP